MMSMRYTAGLTQKIKMWRFRKLVSKSGSDVGDQNFVPASEPNVANKEDEEISASSDEWRDRLCAFTRLYSTPEGRSLHGL